MNFLITRLTLLFPFILGSSCWTSKTIITKPNGTLECLFDNVDTRYACEVVETEIFVNYRVVIANVSDTHKDDKGDDDVTALYARDISNLTLIPEDIGEFFENLIIVEISNTSLKRVNPSDLKQFAKVQFLYLDHNRLGSLEEDTFLHTKHLRKLKLNDNRIFNIDTRVFKHLMELVMLDLSGNECEKAFSIATTKIELQSVLADIGRGECVFLGDHKPSKLDENWQMILRTMKIAAITAFVALIAFVIARKCIKSEPAKAYNRMMLNGDESKMKKKKNIQKIYYI